MEEGEEPTVAQLQRALHAVHSHVLREARARGWCGEYELVVDRINAELGFQALGKRVRRQSVNVGFELRARGDQQALAEVRGEFIAYVQEFRPKAVELVDVIRVTVNDLRQDVEEAFDGDPTGADPRGRREDGYVTGACNCNECRDDRMRSMRPVPPRFT